MPDSAPSTADRMVRWGLAGAVAVFAALFATIRIYDYDFWWHLATGDWILSQGAVPTADPFTFGTPDVPWVPHYWLSDVLFALLNRLAGVDAIILCKAAVVGGAFLVAFAAATRRGASPWLAAAVLGFVVPVARFRFQERPHVFMFLMTALFVWVLTTWGRDNPRRAAFVLVPLMVLWANLHGSFFVGGLLVGFALMDAWVRWFIDRRANAASREEKAALPLGWLWLALAMAGAALLTPHSLGLVQWVVGDVVAKSVTYSFEIEEHLPLKWGDHAGFWVLMFATWASFVLVWRRLRVFDLLLVAFTTYIALASVRYVGKASMLQSIVLAANLGTTWRRWAPVRLPRWLVPAVMTPALAVGGAWSFTTTFTPEKTYHFGLGVDEARFPVAAVAFLRDQGFEGALFNTWEFGGYLIYNLPKARVFVDGRCLDEQLVLFNEVASLSHMELQRYLDAHDVRAAVLSRRDQAYTQFFSTSLRYQSVFFDDKAVVYVRNDLAKSGQLQAFRLIQPDSYDVAYLEPLAKGEQAAAAEEELRRAVAMAPKSFQAHHMLGFFLQVQKRPEALDAYEAAIDANATLAFTHFGLGVRAGRLALETRAFARAEAIARRALEQDEKNAELHFILGTALQQQGRNEEAATSLQEALDRDPGNVVVLMNLGYVTIDLGRPADAVPLFQAAADKAPQLEGAQYGLALALDRAGDGRARAQWQAFLERFPQSRWAAKARERLAAP